MMNINFCLIIILRCAQDDTVKQLRGVFTMASLSPTIWGNYRLDWGQQTHVMGIINVTPDSFSGDGLVEETLTQDAIIARAVAEAQQFVAEGATLIDVGGESTRPHFAPISVE